MASVHFLKRARPDTSMKMPPGRAGPGRLEPSRAMSAPPKNLNYSNAGSLVGYIPILTALCSHIALVVVRVRLVYGAGTGCQSGQFNVAVMLNASPII